MPPCGRVWTGLSIGPDGTFWVSTTTDLYTLDPGTGVYTLVGTFGTTGGLVIDIAVNAFNQMYAHDIADDSIYSVDIVTGAATLVGPTGLDSNYAQGMDFDFSDNTLYAFTYQDGGTNVFGTVDLTTGGVTALATSNPTGEFEGAIQVPAGEAVFCNGPAVQFEDGIPGTWTNLDNGGPFAWVTTANASVTANETGGTGEAATADADAFGSSGFDYDAELWSNPFDLSSASAATLDYRYRFRSAGNSEVFDIDVTTDGGSSWTNLAEYTGSSNPGGSAGDADSIDLSAWAGLSDVQLRFRYSCDAWDWYSQVDELALNCAQPAIALTKTVGTTPGVCAGTDSIVVGPATDVYYCYTVTNRGNVSFAVHDLVDSELGTLLDDFSASLAPGASYEYVHTALTVSSTVTNDVTWTALVAGAESASAHASATVTVVADLCDDALEMTCPNGGGTTSYLGTTIGATFTDQGTCDYIHTAPEVWYHVVGNGYEMRVETCTNTSWDTKISVWSGACGALTCVAGDDDSCLPQSMVSWTSMLGTDYYVMVHGFLSSVGDFELTLTCDVPVELQTFTIQ